MRACIIFAASPIAKDQKFNSSTSEKTYDSTTVYANHYGASDLRAALQGMLMDTNGNTETKYFTTTEQGLMNATTVTTKVQTIQPQTSFMHWRQMVMALPIKP